jgi:hypothetical protein
MALKSSYQWNTFADLREKRKAEQTAELEAWWNQIAPSSERFDPDRAIALMLRNASRYEAALLRIAEKAEEHKALTDHFTTGPEDAAVEMARYLSYLKTARIAAEALARPALTASLKHLEGQQG